MGGIDVTIIPQQVDLGAEVDDTTLQYSGTPEKLNVKKDTEYSIVTSLCSTKTDATEYLSTSVTFVDLTTFTLEVPAGYIGFIKAIEFNGEVKGSATEWVYVKIEVEGSNGTTDYGVLVSNNELILCALNSVGTYQALDVIGEAIKQKDSLLLRDDGETSQQISTTDFTIHIQGKNSSAENCSIQNTTLKVYWELMKIDTTYLT